MKTIYLDNAATTRVCREAASAVLDAMTVDYGNPSSSHLRGRTAAAVLKRSRERIAGTIGAPPGSVCFTSGGTESDNMAILGALRASRGKRHIITGAAEHDAVRNTCKKLESEGFRVTYLSPQNITPEKVLNAVTKDTALVSLMLVNNETGFVAPIADIFKAVKSRFPDIILHTDAVQGYMKIKFTAKALNADMITISSHKIHGPKGVGAIYIRKGLRIPPLMTGGEQEFSMRPGTEPMPAIAGFAAAAETAAASFDSATNHICEMREYIKARLADAVPEAHIVEGTKLLSIADAVENQDATKQSAPHILNISIPGQRGEVLMNVLDAGGVCVSTGSACRRGKRSHVLESMNLAPEIIDGAIRVSLSAYNTKEEIDTFIALYTEANARLRRKL